MSTYVLWLRSQSDANTIHHLRALLKTLDHHHWRCISAHEEKEFLQPVQTQEVDMDKSDLEKLRAYAASSRSPVNFAGTTFIKFDWKAGKWTAGKAGTDMTGRKLVADLPDAMRGFQKLESGQKPLYALTRILDATVEPIERSELGDNVKALWPNNKDPWTPVTAVPFFDQETRAAYLVVAAYGERDAAANLLAAFADHSAAHPEAAAQLPIVTFAVRQFVKSAGETGYAARFDVEGWVDRPEAVLHLTPPPLSIATEVKAHGGLKTAAAGDGQQAAAPTSDKATTDDQAKPKRKISVSGSKSDFGDDEIPFAPEWRG
jgi:hypothetical protein